VAKYSSVNLTLTFGGTAMTAYIDEIDPFVVEALIEDGRPFGSAWPVKIPVGEYEVPDISVGGFYDDTAVSGPDAKFGVAAMPTGPASAAAALVITWGGTKTSTVNCFVKRYERIAKKNGVTRFKAMLAFTGQVTEA